MEIVMNYTLGCNLIHVLLMLNTMTECILNSIPVSDDLMLLPKGPKVTAKAARMLPFLHFQKKKCNYI